MTAIQIQNTAFINPPLLEEGYYNEDLYTNIHIHTQIHKRTNAQTHTHDTTHALTTNPPEEASINLRFREWLFIHV